MNCMGLLKGERGSITETCLMSSDDAHEVINIKVEEECGLYSETCLTFDDAHEINIKVEGDSDETGSYTETCLTSSDDVHGGVKIKGEEDTDELRSHTETCLTSADDAHEVVTIKVVEDKDEFSLCNEKCLTSDDDVHGGIKMKVEEDIDELGSCTETCLTSTDDVHGGVKIKVEEDIDELGLCAETCLTSSDVAQEVISTKVEEDTDELSSCTKTYLSSSADSHEVVMIETAEGTDVKVENVPQSITFPEVQTEHQVRPHRKRAATVGSDLCTRREGVRTVLCKIASSPSHRRRADMADQSRSRRAADICVLETDLPGGQYGMAEEFTEKLIEKVREYVFLYDTGHPEYKNLVKKAEAWRDICKELDQTSETVKQKWKNLRDSYIMYKRFLKGMTGQATKKYEKWLWSRHLEFLDYTLTPCPATSNVSDSQISETPLQEAGTPPLSQDGESSCPLSPTSLEMPIPPIKKLKEKQSAEDIDKLIGYLENKNKNQLDSIDHLFLSYAETFKQFTPRRQAMLTIELATLFPRAEISELDVQTTPASSPLYSANSVGSGLTSDESNVPHDSMKLTYTDLSVSTNLNNAFQHIDFSQCSFRDVCENAYLLVQPK